MKFLIANWKAEMEFPAIQEWVATFSRLFSENKAVQQAIENHTVTIIVCPPFPFIPYVLQQLKHTHINVGMQDVSSQPAGKFTGEVSAKSMEEFVSHAIVGHSERRTHFNESEECIAKKIIQCTAHGIQPILCIRGTQDTLHAHSKIIAYEPPAAIGSGNNEDPLAVVEVKHTLTISPDTAFLYGGSVNRDNAHNYIKTGEIDGFLVGGASLDASHFFELALKLT